MKIERPSSNHRLRNMAIVIITIAVAILGYLAFAQHFQKWPFSPTVSSETPQNTVNYDKPTDQQVSAGTTTKEQVADATNNSSEGAQTTQNGSTIPVSFTSVQPGSTVYIRILIGVVISTATCSIDMSGPGGKLYSASAGVQALSSSSTCQGFNIPMTSLASGTWKITATVKDGSSVGSATTEKDL